MTFRLLIKLTSALAVAFLVAFAAGTATAEELAPPASDSGVFRVKSAFSIDETVARLKQDIASKGIKFFDAIDQAKLAAGGRRPFRLNAVALSLRCARRIGGAGSALNAGAIDQMTLPQEGVRWGSNVVVRRMPPDIGFGSNPKSIVFVPWQIEIS